MEELEAQFKRSSLGVASIAILIGAVLVAALYNYIYSPVSQTYNPDANPGVGLEGIGVFMNMAVIVVAGGFLSLCFAIVSLVANEKKIFPLITIALILIPFILIIMLPLFN